MSRLALSLWIVCITAAAILLYQVKYEVQSLHAQVQETSLDVEQEKEALHVVAAEWAYLNRPARLQALADKYLSSSVSNVQRVADMSDIPFPKQMLSKNEVSSNIHPAVWRAGDGE